METKIILQSDSNSHAAVLDCIQKGGVVAFPTDTVYGIGCAVGNPLAIQQLYKIKERDALKAIPVLVGDLSQLQALSPDFNQQAMRLAEEFWPGALTIIVEKKHSLPQELTTYPTVGIRMPAHDWLREIIRQSGPLATTSANISGAASTTTAREVLDQLDGRIELIIDGGICKGGIPSTVVDCSQSAPKILREGGISVEQITSRLSAA